MKINFVKAVIIICSFFLVTTNAKAGENGLTADTSKKSLLASNEIISPVILHEANVVYPEVLEDHLEASIDYVAKFAENRRSYLLRTFAASPVYIKNATQVFNKYEVPEAFCLLMALESGFKANARSSAGAVGYWQFMDEVAREYGLRTASVKLQKKIITRKGKKITVTRKYTTPDDRKDFAKSTDAAARYLRDRMRNLNNDWLLVAASYNWGIGNVWQAMKRCGKENPGFWDIKKYLPAETKAYVMNFITLNVIANNYDAFVNGDLCFKNINAETSADAANLALPPVVLIN